MHRYLKTPEALIFLVSTWFALVYNAGFWRVIAANAPPGGMADIAYFTSFLALAIGLTSLILLLFVFGRATRVMLGIAMAVAAMTGYFTSKYGVLFDKGMLTNVIETNQAEALELVSLPLILVIVVAGILPALATFRYPLVRRRFAVAATHRGVALVLALCLVAGPLFADQKEVFSVARNHREIQHMLTPLNVIGATMMLARDHMEAPQAFHPVARDARHPTAEYEHRKPLVHVLIVGETARASSFRLDGYPLDTNPELARKDGIEFIEAHSCGTATAVSLPCMFSIQEHDDFDREASRHEDNLLDVAAHAGYSVFWIDNGNGCKGICARVTHRDVHVSDVDEICPDGECYDEILVTELRRILDDVNEDTFILLHGLGSHGPAYFRRYPEEFRHFQPDCRSPNLGDCSTQEIENSYDNTIVYTDHIIAASIEALEERSAEFETSLIYMSDHGESLGEHGLYLHGMPYSLAPDEQTAVPMIVWLGPDGEEGNQAAASCLDDSPDRPVSHDNLFHTELGLLGISTAAYKPELDVLSSCHARTAQNISYATNHSAATGS